MLSYVWGNSPLGQALKSNIQGLQEADAPLQDSIPLTIRNVIVLLRELKIPYLWVDRLCIIQDDPENKAKHLRNMSSIYSNATFTVVVALGDSANFGLRGIRGVTSHLDQTETLESRATIFTSIAITGLLTRFPKVECSRWYSRALTLQEMVFSRRILYFTPDGASWECHCHSLVEKHPMYSDYVMRPCQKSYSDILRTPHFTPWPNIHLYLQLVAAYNNRELTHDADIKHAFQGVLSLLERCSPGGFLHGLPELFLDVALLWQPTGNSTRRLQCRHESSVEESHECESVPDWSWMAWKTPVCTQSWKCGYDYVKKTLAMSWSELVGFGYGKVFKADRKTSWKVKKPSF